jgi:amino acid transporter
VDRLDTWLNAQHGWRRLTIIGVASYAPIACLSFGCLDFFSLLSSSGPSVPVRAVVAIAVLAVPAAVGLGSITAMIHSRRARSPKRRKGWPPFLMWRQTALLWMILAGIVTAPLTPPGNRTIALVHVIFAILVIPLAAETYRYSRRFTRALGEVKLPALGVE